MKPRLSHQPEAAMTLLELGVVIAILIVSAMLLLPRLATANRRSSRMNCHHNLAQIGLAYRLWEGDNGDTYPMRISVTNGGSLEMVTTGNVVQTFVVMSNELSTTKVLVCPNDPTRSWATNFGGLSNSNISYFVAVEVTNDANPQMILTGDCNFEIGGKPVKSGLLHLGTNDPVAWQPSRHETNGYLGLADGSVQTATTLGLRSYLVQTGLATNRLAIP